MTRYAVGRSALIIVIDVDYTRDRGTDPIEVIDGIEDYRQLQIEAIFIVSWKVPSFTAPSPKQHITIFPVSSSVV